MLRGALRPQHPPLCCPPPRPNRRRFALGLVRRPGTAAGHSMARTGAPAAATPTPRSLISSGSAIFARSLCWLWQAQGCRLHWGSAPGAGRCCQHWRCRQRRPEAPAGAAAVEALAATAGMMGCQTEPPSSQPGAPAATPRPPWHLRPRPPQLRALATAAGRLRRSHQGAAAAGAVRCRQPPGRRGRRRCQRPAAATRSLVAVATAAATAAMRAMSPHPAEAARPSGGPPESSGQGSATGSRAPQPPVPRKMAGAATRPPRRLASPPPRRAAPALAPRTAPPTPTPAATRACRAASARWARRPAAARRPARAAATARPLATKTQPASWCRGSRSGRPPSRRPNARWARPLATEPRPPLQPSPQSPAAAEAVLQHLRRAAERPQTRPLGCCTSAPPMAQAHHRGCPARSPALAPHPCQAAQTAAAVACCHSAAQL